MLVLRSLVFNILFYANLIAWMIAALPFLVLPRRYFVHVAKGWARSCLWLMRVVAGTKVEFRGRERIPPGGLILASKHQSLWETFALFPEMEDGAFILKHELTWIPLFGWYLWKQDMVPVNRAGGSSALTRMNARAREVIAAGRQIIMFPEGTRRQAGAPPAYKYGVVHLYASTGAPCLPVALNSGVYWPRRKFLRRPGTIVVEFLEVIPPGLSRAEFYDTLQHRIEEASDRLLAEAIAETGYVPPPRVPSPDTGPASA